MPTLDTYSLQHNPTYTHQQLKQDCADPHSWTCAVQREGAALAVHPLREAIAVCEKGPQAELEQCARQALRHYQSQRYLPRKLFAVLERLLPEVCQKRGKYREDPACTQARHAIAGGAIALHQGDEQLRGRALIEALFARRILGALGTFIKIKDGWMHGHYSLAEVHEHVMTALKLDERAVQMHYTKLLKRFRIAPKQGQSSEPLPRLYVNPIDSLPTRAPSNGQIHTL